MSERESKNKEKKIKIPEHISKEQHRNYVRGYKLYHMIDKFSDAVISNLSEDDIYYMAVVALETKDLEPLQRLGNKLAKKPLTDKYYWSYLSDDPYLFYSTIEVEMFRRRTSSTIHLYDLSEFKKDFSTILGVNYSITSKGDRIYSPKVESYEGSYLSYKDIKYIPVLKLYHPDIVQTCKEILKNGCIIAGGFVNSIVNPMFEMVKIDLEELREDVEKLHSIIFSETYDGNIEDYIEKNILWINGCYRLWYTPAIILVLNWAHYQIYHAYMTDEYDIDTALKELKYYVHLRDDEDTESDVLYQLVLQKSNDMDIFFTKANYHNLANVTKILFDHNKVIKNTNFATTFKKSKQSFKYQIIKRLYNNVEETLTGFDIDSSRVALVFEEGKGLRPLATKSYVYAVECGINLIVPCRQSQTFNKRLKKYKNRGFTPYLTVPFDIKKINFEPTHPKGTLLELLFNMEKLDLFDYPQYRTILAESRIKSSRVIEDYSQMEEDSEDTSTMEVKIISNNMRKQAKFLDFKSAYNSDKTDEQARENLVAYCKNNKINSPPERKYLIENKIIKATKKDVLYMIDCVTRIFNIGKIQSSTSSLQFVQVNSVYEKFAKFVTSISWLDVDPDTQFTGSFNPTHIDYLLGSERESIPEIKHVDKLLEPLTNALGVKSMALRVLHYYRGENLDHICEIVRDFGLKLKDLDEEYSAQMQ